MNDVCLIYLPKPYLKQPDSQAPLGLMYLAASLEELGRSVTIENCASLTDDEAVNSLPPAHLYGITTTSLEILQANRFSEKLKKRFPSAKIVLGGPGVYSHEFIDFGLIDSICLGDGELTIHNILQDARNNTMRPHYFGKMVEDLDMLPLPARHLLKTSQGGDIFAYGHHYAGGDSTIIVSSRGCAFKCAFCSAPKLTHNNKMRFRDPKEVAREMKHVKEAYGIEQFRFSDDLLTVSEKRTINLCREIAPLDINFRISTRVKPLTTDMLKALRDAGCKEFSFGIESADQKVLDGLNKKATVEDNIRALEISHEYGFVTRALMMIHTPFQTPETIELNKEFLRNTPIDIMALTNFIPIPGCDVHANPDKYGIELLDVNLDDFNFYFFGPEGRLPIKPIFKIKNRPLQEFIDESESFRDWVESDYKKINKG